jgi:hypothetical protein
MRTFTRVKITWRKIFTLVAAVNVTVFSHHLNMHENIFRHSRKLITGLDRYPYAWWIRGKTRYQIWLRLFRPERIYLMVEGPVAICTFSLPSLRIAAILFALLLCSYSFMFRNNLWVCLLTSPCPPVSFWKDVGEIWLWQLVLKSFAVQCNFVGIIH